MSELQFVTIQESCEILDHMRMPLNSEERSSILGNIPYYGANGIQGYINDYIFDEELILLAEDGGYFEDFNTKPIAYKIKGKSWVNNHAHILRTRDDYYLDFVFYSLQHKNIVSFIKGGTRSKLNQSELKEITFWYVPYKKQKKIAKILSTVDKLIEHTQALIDKYTAIEQGLMTDLFTRGIDPTTKQLRPSPQDAPELYKETELGLVPKEWDIKELQEIARVERGKFTHRPRDDSKCYGGVYPFIQTGNVTNANGGMIKKYSQTLNEFGRSVSKEFKAGTIAVTIAANIADTGILAIPMCFPDSIVGVIVDESKAITKYIEVTIQRSKQKLDAIAPLSAQKNINLEDLRPLKIGLPPIEEQYVICKRYEANDKLIYKENEFLKKLKKQKKGLMQDLLTGKVRLD